MNIFREFDTIISALSKSQYAPLYKSYHEKDEDIKQRYTYLIHEINAVTDFDSLIRALDSISIKSEKFGDPKFRRSLFKCVNDELNLWSNKDKVDFIKEGIKKFIEKYITQLYSPSKNRNLYNQLFDSVEKGLPKNTPYRSNKDRIVIPITIHTDSPEGQSWLEMNECVCIMGLAHLYFKYLAENSTNGQTKERNSKESDRIGNIFNFVKNRLGKPDEYFSNFPNYMKTNMYEFVTQEGRKITVSKILKLVKEKLDESETKNFTIMPVNTLITRLNQRTPNKEMPLIIVISRHPYDIGGMSTGRGWTSCMNLETGSNRRYVESSMKHGGLIAYLCYPDDTVSLKDSTGRTHSNNKINIQRPIGRVLIKPFYKASDGQLNYIEPNFVLRCSKVYGNFYSEAIKILQNWLDENWNTKIYKSGEEYSLSDSLYKEPEDFKTIADLRNR